MRMILKKILGLILSLIAFVSLVDGQGNSNKEAILGDRETLDLRMNHLIEKEFYQDSTKMIRIIFTFKVDSLGEVHSAHIRTSKNLKPKEFYTICLKIESEILIPFIFTKYSNSSRTGKYVYVNYPYYFKP
jgi:hypothetical protein